MVKKKKGVTIRIKDFGTKGKGRKGKYYYVKEPKQRPKYYKYKKDISKKDVIEYYRRGITSKRYGISKKRLQKERRLDRVAKKYPKIEKVLETGYAEYTIKNAERLTPAGVRNSYRYLLLNKDRVGDGKGVVRDKELLELITRSENVDKWKHRVLFEVQLRNNNGEIIATINNTRVKHLGELRREILNELRLGESYDFTGIGSPDATSFKSDLARKISKKGYRVNVGTSPKSKLSDIKIKMVFRKSRK